MSTWYEPHTDPEAIRRGIEVALGTPGVSALCTPGEVSLLPAVLSAIADARPLGEGERRAAIDASRDDALIFPIPS